ncbi:universal stress protein [Dermatophilaceae bacterium Sec6.4]
MNDLRNKPIVVGFDDHEASRKALLQAVELSAALQVHLHVVHVIGMRDTPIDPDSMDWEEEFDEHLKKLQQHARQLITLPADAWTYHAVDGDAWRQMLLLSEQVDAGMIVVGQHLHAHAVASALGHLLGSRRKEFFSSSGKNSVSDHLLHHGGRSILIVTTADEISS